MLTREKIFVNALFMRYTVSQRASNTLNQVAEAKRFEDVLCRKVC